MPWLAIIKCGAVVDYHLLRALLRQGIDTRAGIKAVARRMRSKGTSVQTGSVPHTLHAPIGIGLLESGKHVFMEKRLATKVIDCERMIQAPRLERGSPYGGPFRRIRARQDYVE